MAKMVESKGSVQRDAYLVSEWCSRYGISRATFYNWQRKGEAPPTFKVGALRFVSVDSDLAWRRARELAA